MKEQPLTLLVGNFNDGRQEYPGSRANHTSKFSPQVAHRVKNLRYHPSQQVAEDGPDGSVTLQFAVCGLLELPSWILPWGTQAEVLEPPELRERVRQAAAEIAGRYDE